MLSYPVQVIGVAQVINKNGGNDIFTAEDEEVGPFFLCVEAEWGGKIDGGGVQKLGTKFILSRK